MGTTIRKGTVKLAAGLRVRVRRTERVTNLLWIYPTLPTPYLLRGHVRHIHRRLVVVWLRNVIGIRRVGRSRRTPGASTGSSERARREEWPDARDPPERPHHPGRARRDRPLGRAYRRAGPALRRQHRDCSQVAQTRADGVPGPLQSPAQAALEGERGGARRGLRAASRHRLPAG